jgi:hypothetical protein
MRRVALALVALLLPALAGAQTTATGGGFIQYTPPGGSSFTGTLSTGQFLAPDGTSAAPAYGFSSDAGSGMFLESSITLSLKSEQSIKLWPANAETLRVQSSGIDFGAAYALFGASLGSADSGLTRYAAGVLRVSDGFSTGVRTLMGGGTAVASAATLPLPTGSVFHVTGTATVTSITSTNFQSGVCVTLIFDSTATITDAGTIKLAGASTNFVATSPRPTTR